MTNLQISCTKQDSFSTACRLAAWAVVREVDGILNPAAEKRAEPKLLSYWVKVAVLSCLTSAVTHRDPSRSSHVLNEGLCSIRRGVGLVLRILKGAAGSGHSPSDT